MKTITVSITNSGPFAQVVPIADGTVTVHPGKTMRDVAILPLSADRVRHYAERGVIFSGRGLPRSEDALVARKAAEEEADRMAAEDAERRRALAEAQAEEDRKAAEEENRLRALATKETADLKAADKAAKKKADASGDLLGSDQ